MKPKGWSRGAKFDGLFVGQVIDRDDPQSLGRVQVKVLGIHTATTGLPWAFPVQPLLGNEQFTVPDEDAWVMVMFLNGQPLQPVYFGQLRTSELTDEEKETFGFTVDDDGTVVEVTVDRENKEVVVGTDSTDWTIIVAGGTIQIKGSTIELRESAFRRLLDERAASAYNTHNHVVTGVQGGAANRTTGGPAPTIDTSHMTSKTKAE